MPHSYDYHDAGQAASKLANRLAVLGMTADAKRLFSLARILNRKADRAEQSENAEFRRLE